MSCNPKVTGSGKPYGSGGGGGGGAGGSGSGSSGGGGAGGNSDPGGNPLKATEHHGNLQFNKEQAALIRAELQAKGYSDVQIAAVMGHWKNESSFNTTIKGDGGNSFGLAQWNKTRWDNERFGNGSGPMGLVQYSRLNGLDPNSVQAQVGFFDWEIRNSMSSRGGDMLRNATTIEEASWAMNNYERFAGWKSPGGETAERLNDSVGFLDYYK